MGERTLTYCDFCSKQDPTCSIAVYGFDACDECVREIVQKVIDGKLIPPRPFCEFCKKVGKIEEWEEEDYHRNRRVVRPCPRCTL